MTHDEGYRRWVLAESASGLLVLIVVAVYPALAINLLLPWALCSYGILMLLGADLTRAADGITLSRVLLASAALASGQYADAFAIQLILFSVAAFTDLADGWLARRSGPTDSGAVLDMEADQMLVLMLAVAVLESSPVGAAVLLLPGLKYGFALCNYAFGLQTGDPKPVSGDNRRAKLIYVFVLSALFSALPALATPMLSTILLGIALPALCTSFAADFLYQWRYQRGNRRGVAP